ncbi:MAG: NAD-dependent epimerase/dehydratase family protein, partial [Clostridiaceae bacterium]|nr:NAD-dependent epimerase/dehydratase family protein [Clostridiaceae bacterium]
MIKGKKIFLTGGAGFIGTKLTNELYRDNHIRLYDNLNRNSIKNTNLLMNTNITLEQGDILDFEQIKKSICSYQPDIIIHLAAVAGIDTVIKSPTTTMKVNMVGTYHVLESAITCNHKVERFIDFSTSEVFGSYAYKVEETSTTNLAPVGEARWTYSVSKLAAEHLTHSYHKEFGLPAVSVRPFNIYGPGQVGEGAIHVFVNKALNNEDLCIHGDGDQIRSWCYVDDFVNAIMLCLENKEAVGGSFNIGNPRGTITINHLAEMIVRLSESKSKIVRVPKNYVDVELRIPSIEKARQVLGYE